MKTDSFTYFDPEIPVDVYNGKLPHWNQPDRVYFVTFRLADSLPQTKLQRWRQERQVWLTEHPEPHDPATRKEYYRRFPKRLHQWLDRGYGSCLLKERGNREIVANALTFFHRTKYILDAWVVMPNHVHVIVAPFASYPLFRITQSWKAYSAREINRRTGKSGEVWQGESYDHIIRNSDAHEKIREYIRNNPKRLQKGTYTLWTDV